MDRLAHNLLAGEVRLRDVIESDLPIFFEQQLDADANQMAAFTARNPTDRSAFMAHWAKILRDDTIIKQTILVAEQVAGNIVKFEMFGEQQVGYWLGRQFWGKGIATRALMVFLNQVPIRPLYARAAKDNLASIRVLEKCGFTLCGEDSEFSNARGKEVAAAILILAANENTTTR